MTRDSTVNSMASVCDLSCGLFRVTTEKEGKAMHTSNATIAIAYPCRSVLLQSANVNVNYVMRNRLRGVS